MSVGGGHDVGSSVCRCLGMLVGELMSAFPRTQSST
jgi:hypothetical protein